MRYWKVVDRIRMCTSVSDKTGSEMPTETGVLLGAIIYLSGCSDKSSLRWWCHIDRKFRKHLRLHPHSESREQWILGPSLLRPVLGKTASAALSCHQLPTFLCSGLSLMDILLHFTSLLLSSLLSTWLDIWDGKVCVYGFTTNSCSLSHTHTIFVPLFLKITQVLGAGFCVDAPLALDFTILHFVCLRISVMVSISCKETVSLNERRKRPHLSVDIQTDVWNAWRNSTGLGKKQL